MTKEDIAFLKAQFLERTGYELNLKHPKTYCEKIQWRKVYVRDRTMVDYADKIASREIVSHTLGNKYLVNSSYSGYGIPSTKTIEDHMLSSCVIKANHGCGWMIFQGIYGKYLKAKQIKHHIKKWLSSSYGKEKLLWADSQITPGVLVEDYLLYKKKQPTLVKLYVFDGVAKIGNVIDHGEHKLLSRTQPVTDTWYDRDGKRIHLRLGHIPSTENPAPKEYAECVRLSEKLGKGIDHIRVDWMVTDKGIKFSEFEWHPTNGMFRLEPPEWDRIMGDWWTLPERDNCIG